MPDQNTVDQKSAELAGVISQKLNDINEQNRKPIVSALTDILFRAQRPSFSGQTLESPGERGAAAGQNIATQLGTRYRTDGETNAYLFARGSESGSGPVVYQDKSSGEIMVLLERPKRNPDRWEFPAGFRNAPNETATTKTEQPRQGSNTVPPTAENMQKMFEAELATMQREKKSAREILDRFENPTELQAMFEKHGITWNPAIDQNAQGAFRREVREETGLALPKDGVHFVRSVTAVSHSGSGRMNHTDHVYVADLGVLEQAPALKIQEEEIAEAKWVPLKNIRRDEKTGAYSVVGQDGKAMPLNQDQAPRLEMALEKYVDVKVKAASAIDVGNGRKVSEFDSARDVVAETQIEAAKQKPARSASLDALISSIDGQDNMRSLVGQEGQRRIGLLITAAKGLANDTPLSEIFKPQANENQQEMPAEPAPEQNQQSSIIPQTMVTLPNAVAHRLSTVRRTLGI